MISTTQKTLRWSGLAIVLLGGLAAFLLLRGGGEGARVSGSAGAPVSVTRGTIEETVSAVGTLEPKDYVDVGAQVSGQIKRLSVDIGYVVSAGDLLAEIDPQVYQSMKDADEAKVASLEAQLAQQKAQLEFDRLQAARAAKLLPLAAVSQEEADEKDKALKMAEAAAQSLEAQIREAKAALEKDMINLGYTKIYAPMSGIISDRKAREGQTLNANQTTPTIVQVANLDVMTIRAEIAEADVMRIKTGMRATFTTMGGDGRVWSGQVRQILPTPEIVNDVVLYNALIDVDNKDGALMNGMSAQVKFVAGRAENVLTAPARVLGPRAAEQDNDKGKAYRVRVLRGDKPEERTVWVGLITRTQVEIRDGALEGDRLAPYSDSAAQGQGQKKTERMMPPNMGARL